MSYSSYQANQAAYDLVFVAAIAASVTGVQTSDVLNLMVVDSPATARRRLLEPSHRPHLTESELSENSHLRAASDFTALNSNSVSLTYTIQILRKMGISYESLSSQLKNSVQGNTFTSHLQYYASVHNVPELRTASSSSVSTKDTTPPLESGTSNSSSSELTVPAIIGIVVAVCACVFGISCACIVWGRKSGRTQVIPRSGKNVFINQLLPSSYVADAYLKYGCQKNLRTKFRDVFLLLYPTVSFLQPIPPVPRILPSLKISTLIFTEVLLQVGLVMPLLPAPLGQAAALPQFRASPVRRGAVWTTFVTAIFITPLRTPLVATLRL